MMSDSADGTPPAAAAADATAAAVDVALVEPTPAAVIDDTTSVVSVTSTAAPTATDATAPAVSTAATSASGSNQNTTVSTTSEAAAAAAAGMPEEFVVERILQVRIRQAKKEYLIKWKGYGPEENSWEPEENCDCPAIVEAFERERRQGARGGAAGSEAASAGKKKADAAVAKKRAALQQVIDFNEAGQPRGFDRGLQPERILGATDSLGELMFLMKWRDCDEADLVPARQANVKCPQVVIAFYEERLSWYNDEEAAA